MTILEGLACSGSLLIVPPSPTSVADEKEDAIEEAENVATYLEKRGVGEALPTSTMPAASRADDARHAERVEADASDQTGAHGDAAPTAGVRAAQRERSPRRELQPGRQTSGIRWADAEEEEETETPQLTVAQSAALRGDVIGGSLDSLPALEEPTPPLPPSNQRGGALHT
jgi:hypothetical protein